MQASTIVLRMNFSAKKPAHSKSAKRYLQFPPFPKNQFRKLTGGGQIAGKNDGLGSQMGTDNRHFRKR